MKMEMAAQYLRVGNYQQAEPMLRQLIADEPDNVQALQMLGNLYKHFHRPDLAIPLLQKAIELDPNTLQTYFELASLIATTGNNETLAALLAKIQAQANNDYIGLVRLGLMAHDLGYFDHSARAYQQAIDLAPERFEAWVNQAVLQRNIGELDSARASLAQALQLNPDCAEAYASLRYLKTFEPGDPELAAMEALYAKLDNAPAQKVQLAYALGKAYEDAGDYSRAFEFYRAANTTARQLTPYNRDAQKTLFSNLKQQFNPGVYASPGGVAPSARKPIFVLGMPRSGTSLVEQILASHQQVTGAGELGAMPTLCAQVQAITQREFPAAITELSPEQRAGLANQYLNQLFRHTPDSEYAVDKLPHNFLYIGVIKLLFPDARIVHCTRDPHATCFSIYKNSFTGNHPYAHDLSDLGDYYNQYRELMAHWHEVFPFQIYDIEYEELVNETEEEIRALLNFCKLPFDDNCLDFHTTQRAVTTASATQVRKPISTAAVNSWENFQDSLEPLTKTLT